MRIEGGLLPPEYLQTINALQATHQANTDYGLTRSLNIKDEIGRYWRMAMDLWADYRERRQRTDLDPVQVAVDEWLQPLFEHILGYHDITPCMPVTIGERHFPIGHKACSKTVPLLLTGHIYDLGKAELRFGDAGRRRPPFGLLQEYLNADDTCLWGMVSNGNLVRLAHDNPSLTRPAFIEADFERMFEEQLFADFAAFWLLFHVSRVAPREGSPAKSILEAWRIESLETGERARTKLRLGVTTALRQFGNGFLEHRVNHGLRHALSVGEITETGYFQELLRLVYRLLFLFTVEDRNLLFHPEASGGARRLYTEGYALSRLRDRALRRRHYDQHSDLWDGLRVVFRGLARGIEPFGLPALGGLFADGQCAHLDTCAITNDRLLQAIHALAFFESGKALARVNYRDMDTEELGSVYESLLELHPTIAVAPWTFGLVGDGQEGNLGGSERKTTGSYYTPPVLVNELIKSALIPIIEHTLQDHPDRPRDALLELKIIDPACGSGHFLLAAARQVAAEVARLDAGPDTPGEALRQHALRDVVQHCIYGVDRNPLAVELCKTALWIETVELGKPLSFLDAHIRCGDSLVGVLDPRIMDDGIPDEAYKPLIDDEKTVANALKRRNQQGGQGVQGNLFDPKGLQPLAVMSFDLDAMPEDTLEEIEAKRQAWNKSQEDHTLQQQTLRADLFVGAFFAPKTRENAEKIPLTEDLHRLAQGLPLRPGLVEAIGSLAQHYGFFHWHLAFPEVFVRGGFDVVLGNPPWDMQEVKDNEFFALSFPEILAVKSAKDKAAILGKIKLTEPRLWHNYQMYVRLTYGQKHFMLESGRFPLSAVGRLNLYRLFLENNHTTVNNNGRVGLVIPSGFASDAFSQKHFNELHGQGRLISLYDFENREALFPGIDRRYKFCLVTVSGACQPNHITDFVFFARNVDELKDIDRHVPMSKRDLYTLNPLSGTAPLFQSKRDMRITLHLHQVAPILAKEDPSNGWQVHPTLMFMMNAAMTAHRSAEELETNGYQLHGNRYIRGEQEWLPLYEGKMVSMYDHRSASIRFDANNRVRRNQPDPLSETEHADPQHVALPMFWVDSAMVFDRCGSLPRWCLVVKDITSATNERTGG
jgi:hypothetical protein